MFTLRSERNELGLTMQIALEKSICPGLEMVKNRLCRRNDQKASVARAQRRDVGLLDDTGPINHIKSFGLSSSRGELLKDF